MMLEVINIAGGQHLTLMALENFLEVQKIFLLPDQSDENL